MIPKSLVAAASFNPDLLQSPSAWLGHLPFAAWVMKEVSARVFVELGTHYGHSYFSFCQSVVEFGLASRCYAVDTWQGDEHAGQYGDEIFAGVNDHNEKNFGQFSQLLRMTFDEAVNYFSNESIGLLHIDGLHTYEAVSHDFETWLPKLAPGAVVMFHDTNVHERNFGVWKLWEDLQVRYPNSLEFIHSHGLGVLQLNNFSEINKLHWLQPDYQDRKDLLAYFSALGSRQLERFELSELKQRAVSLNQAIAERDGQLTSLKQAAAERDGQLASLKQAAAERDGQLASLNQAIVERDGQLAGLNQAIVERDGQLAGLNHAVVERDGQLAGLNHAVGELDGQLFSLNQAIAERDGQLASLNQAVGERNVQLASLLSQAIAERDGQVLAGLNQAIAERDGQLAGLKQAITERDGQISSLLQTISERDAHITALYHSTSWRMMGPMRIAAHQMKRARRIAELAAPAIEYGGGIKKTLRKALSIYQKEGLPGIKRGFRLVAASQMPIHTENINPVYVQAVKHPAEQLLAPRVLIIAEMSIAQCRKYRVQQKHDMFESLQVDCTMLNWSDTQACINAMQTHSLVIFYRVPGFSNVISVINEAKRLGLPTLWEVDDFIFDKEVLANSKTLAALDKTTYDQLLDGAELYRKAMLLCDKGIASTPRLAEAMKMAGLPQVYVIENALDQETLEIAQKVRRKHIDHQDGILRIVYGSGTNTHNIDFQEAAPAILRILEKHPGVRFRLIGSLDLPESFSFFEDRVERLPVCGYEEYLTSLAECDVSIAPLEDYIFNDSKSNIKYLEASIVKVPSVCSPRVAFSLAIVDGENGFLCDTDEEWEAALTLLVTDAAARVRISDAAYLSVMGHYAPKSIAQQQVAPLLARHARNPETLRVLSVNCYYHPRSFGGATIVAEEINKRINAQDGFDVHVFTTVSPSVVAPYTVKRYEADDINIYGVGLPEHLDEKTQFENLEIVSAFADVLEVVQPDIVHFHSIQGIGISVVDLCVKKGIKYIITLHDAWWICGRQFMINKERKYCGQKNIDLKVCASCVDNNSLNLYRNKRLADGLRHASALLAPSRYFADLHIANGFADVEVNKNGIVKPRSMLRLRRKGSLRFGYVGGNTEIKGIHLIKKVFADLASYKFKLVLVDNALNLGFTSYHPQELEAIPNFEIVPAYTQSNIDEFFAGIDVLLFPTQWKESFGLTVREALARNVWVITTDAGGVVEDIKHGCNGYIIPFSDAGAALKQAVIDTLEHFDRIKPGREVALGSLDITFFEDQAAELTDIFKYVFAGDSVRVAHMS
jgi:O-antigen biosynthesis protein